MYTAPSGTLVYWVEAAQRGLKNPTVIDLSKQWDPRDPLTFYDRYAEGDRSQARVGSSPVTWDGKRQGGESYEQVKAWLWAQGERREPSDQEIVDWSLKLGNQAAPIPGPDGSKSNPFPFHDRSLPHGSRFAVDDVHYMNDWTQPNLGKLPASQRPTTPTAPVPPPVKPTDPAPPKPLAHSAPSAQVRQIRHTFAKAEEIDIPPGTVAVIFDGSLTISTALKGDAIRPLLGIKLGIVGQREVGALFCVGGAEQIRVEGGGRRSKEFGKGFGKVKNPGSNAVRFEWRPGLAVANIGEASRTYQTGVTEGWSPGSVIVLGVDQGSEYQQLPQGSILEGRATFVGATTQEPPVDNPPPPTTGGDIEEARSHLRVALAILNRLS